jgi:hypothetical protein
VMARPGIHGRLLDASATVLLMLLKAVVPA